MLTKSVKRKKKTEKEIDLSGVSLEFQNEMKIKNL